MLKIEDMKVGDSEEFQVDITLKDHNKFKEFTGDESPLHTDDKFAASTIFRKKIAYGFHVVSYLSRLYGKYLPGGSSVCIMQNIKFLKPVYIDDKLTVKGTIVNINRNMKLITLKAEIKNQKNETCVNGEAILKMII